MKVTSVGSRFISLSWSPPQAALQNGYITGYVIAYGSEVSRARMVNLEGQSQLNLTLTGLNPYTAYTLSVRAHNAKGEGPESPLLFVLTDQDGKANLKVIVVNQVPLMYWITIYL